MDEKLLPMDYIPCNKSKGTLAPKRRWIYSIRKHMKFNGTTVSWPPVEYLPPLQYPTQDPSIFGTF